MNPQVAGALKRPFAEQLAFFRGKLGNLVPTARWDDIWKEQHDRAFMVAGAIKADLLADLASAVERSIAGGSLGEFRSEFDAIVAKHGWSYTGERNWRTRVIYQTNAATSYAAGRLRQLREFPLWLYKHGGSADPRPEHLAWDGTVLAADDPFWSTHYPPNGWGCSCRVVGMRDRESARRYGGDPDKSLPAGWDDIDAATGEPTGVGRGWGYQPGATAGQLQQQLTAKAATLPPPLSTQLQQAIASVSTPPTLKTLDEFLADGLARVKAMPDGNADPSAFISKMMADLDSQVGIRAAAAIKGTGQGAKTVAAASRLFPDSWTNAADAYGTLAVRGGGKRGWQYSADQYHSSLRLPGFGTVPNVNRGAGFISIRTGDIGNAVHEYAHRIQVALPALDDLFQQLHRRRTAGDPLRSLRSITGNRGYRADERAREDNYINAYVGKEYTKGGALEVMTMAFEALLTLGGDPSNTTRIAQFREFYNRDPELFALAVSLLFGWRP